MAPPHNPPNQVRLSTLPLSFSTEHRRRGCSKAQMCFFKILHIISVFPNVDVTDEKCLTRDDEMCQNLGFVVDLNVRLRPESETERLRCPETANGGDRGDCENSECEMNEKSDRLKSEDVVAVEEERATEHSEISHVGDQSSGVEELEENRKPRDEGYLGLLFEAAELILAGDCEQDKKRKREPESEPKLPRSKTEQGGGESVGASATVTAAERGGAKRKSQCWTAAAEAEWYAEFEDTSPVVRSKRGRSQVLPYKYRDSVVEPLVRWSSPAGNQRSISNTAVALKRRSK